MGRYIARSQVTQSRAGLRREEPRHLGSCGPEAPWSHAATVGSKFARLILPRSRGRGDYATSLAVSLFNSNSSGLT